MYEPYNSWGFNNGYGNNFGNSFGNNFNQRQPQRAFLKGRPVGCLDEVKGCPVDMDGSITYFPSPSENKIYTKFIDMNGCSVVESFRKEQPIKPQNEIALLQARVTELEKFVKELTGDEPNGNNATNGTNAAVPKPTNVATTNGYAEPYVG